MGSSIGDALDRLARREELRRRCTDQAAEPIVPPALGDLVEAVARVVTRHPELLVMLGVDGAGPPVLARVCQEDGTVQVTVRPAGSGPVPAAPGWPVVPPPPSTEPASADQVAARLAALLREDPSLLQPSPD